MAEPDNSGTGSQGFFGRLLEAAGFSPPAEMTDSAGSYGAVRQTTRGTERPLSHRVLHRTHDILLSYARAYGSEALFQQSPLTAIASRVNDGVLLFDPAALRTEAGRLVLTGSDGQPLPQFQVLLDHLKPGLTRAQVEQSLQTSHQILLLSNQLGQLQQELVSLTPAPPARPPAFTQQRALDQATAQHRELQSEYQLLRQGRHYQRLRDLNAANRTPEDQREFERLTIIPYEDLEARDQESYRRLGGFTTEQAERYSTYAGHQHSATTIGYAHTPDQLDTRIQTTGRALAAARRSMESLTAQREAAARPPEPQAPITPEVQSRIDALRARMAELQRRSAELQASELQLRDIVDPDRRAAYQGALGAANITVAGGGGNYTAYVARGGEMTAFIFNGVNGESELAIGPRGRVAISGTGGLLQARAAGAHVEYSALDTPTSVADLSLQPDDAPLVYRPAVHVPGGEMLLGYSSHVSLLGGELDLTGLSRNGNKNIQVESGSGRIVLAANERTDRTVSLSVFPSEDRMPTTISLPATAELNINSRFSDRSIDFTLGGNSISASMRDRSGNPVRGNVELELRSANPNVRPVRIPLIVNGVAQFQREEQLEESLARARAELQARERNNGIMPSDAAPGEAVSVPAAIPLVPPPVAPQR